MSIQRSLIPFLVFVSTPAIAFSQATQLQKLVGSTVGAGANFGRSVSLSGGDLLAGTSATSSTKNAYVFGHGAGGWNEQAILGVPNFGNGLVVAIRGDLALLGAHAYDGYAWRVQRTGGVWGAPVLTTAGIGHDEWGYAVAIGEASELWIGAPHADSCFPNEAGIVAGYCPSGPGWNWTMQLNDPNPCGINFHQGFGCSLSASGPRVAVGANGVDPTFGVQTGPGQAFVFERTCAGGSALTAFSGPGPRFGESVALDRDTLIIGQYGAAFAYARVGAAWVPQGTLDAQDPLAGAEYGSAVAVHGDIALVGARTSSVAGSNSGAVYVFRRSGSSWSRIQVLTGNDTVAGDRFGSALAIEDYTIAVGAPLCDASGTDSGAVYVFTLPQAPPDVYCVGKANSLGCVPQIGFDGVPSASAAAVFDVSAIQELNQKTGLLLYGTNGIATTVFQGGVLCIAAPLHRTAGQSSLGSAQPANDCTGSYHYDFNARIQSGFDPGLLPGVRVAAQYWSRDPQDLYGTALSDALLFTIGP